MNGQYSSRSNIKVGVPEGSILGQLLFFVYIKNISDDLATNVKLFGDGTSLFSAVHNMDTYTINFTNDLKQNQKLGESVEHEF